MSKFNADCTYCKKKIIAVLECLDLMDKGINEGPPYSPWIKGAMDSYDKGHRNATRQMKGILMRQFKIKMMTEFK